MFLSSSSSHSNPAGVVVFFGFLAVFLLFAFIQRQRRRTAFRRAADTLGATVRSISTNELTASLRGFVFTFHLDPGGKNSPPHTYIHVKTPPFDLLLDLIKEGDKKGKRAGYVDIDVGDAAFDGAWIVEGAPVGRIKRLLADEALRRRLVRCADHDNAEVQVEDGDVHFSKRGMDYQNGALLMDNLELMVDLASAVMAENARPAPDAVVTEGDYRSAPAQDTDRTGDRAQIATLKRQRAARTAGESRIQLFLAPVAMIGLTIAFFSFAGKPPPFARIFLLVELGMVAMFMRSIGSSYFAARRTAGLAPDYALLATLAAVVAAAVAASLGAFGF
jgi:hypothetical protein